MTVPLAGRPTFAAIDAGALRANFAAVRAFLPAHVAVMAVVKANAYGHGAALAAPIFEAAGADYLGIATIEEGVELRAAGVRKPILVLTGVGAGDDGFRQAMRLVTHVLELKAVPAEFPISYGQTFVTRRPSVIATLPIGYADGYSRKLSNRASVLIRGRRAPVIGTVCMDLTMVDVTEIGGVQLGDEVVLWGRQNGAEISVTEVAAWQETIAYEVLTGVGRRVPRILQ